MMTIVVNLTPTSQHSRFLVLEIWGTIRRVSFAVYYFVLCYQEDVE